jgi:hypothetical protein
MPEQMVAMTLPSNPGSLAYVTLASFLSDHQYAGWELAGPEDQPPVVYDLTSNMLGVPGGIATLGLDGNVVQPGGGGGGGGGVDEAAVNLLIDAKINALIADQPWIPETTPAVVFNSGVIETPQRATHPTPVAGKRQDYLLTDGTAWVQLPSGARTQVAPGWKIPVVELGAEKLVNSLTLSTVVAAELEPDAGYAFEFPFIYESTVAASGERLRFQMDPPPGATGHWGVQGLAVTQAAANGSTSYAARTFSESFDIGGSGAGTANARRGVITGLVFTASHNPPPDTASLFEIKARLSTLDGAGVPLVPAKIYGANTATYDAGVATFRRFV